MDKIHSSEGTPMFQIVFDALKELMMEKNQYAENMLELLRGHTTIDDNTTCSDMAHWASYEYLQ